ncbi:unnamed protein product [Diatraea saccharalis]|uniref:Cystathionine beta-synthase n=1 Tax=Diatraea saccharalis TaxID=40085 RepID=A0A9N9R496_9NEOP|nr:unnamed protein product [Diatraea saccharalis]
MSSWLNYVQNLKTLNQHKISYPRNTGPHRVYQNIQEVIGNTPLVRLNKIPKDHGVECEIYAKCEYFNPAGSIKDRIGYTMMEDAVANGVVNDQTVFVEPTSGNTGIAIVFNASLRGNKSILVLSEKNSDEKVNTMRLLGAEVIQIKDNVSDVDIATEIKDKDPNAIVLLEQFDNDVNPRTHYEHTGEEIYEALGPVDVAVMGAGTGGTITGVAHKLKEHNPNCVVVAADPDGSVLFNTHGKQHPFLVEGITGSDVPIVLDKSIVDTYEVVTDEEAFLMARELCKKEGLLCGGSSGLITAAAIKAAKRLKLKAGQRMVVVLPDGIRNYMTKFVSDQWMEAYRFLEPPQHDMKWWNRPITDVPKKDYIKIDPSDTCRHAYLQLTMKRSTVALVVDKQGYLVGAVSIDSFRNYATNPTTIPGKKTEEFNFSESCGQYLVKHIYKLALNDNKGIPTVGLVSRVLDIAPFVIVGQEIDINHFKPYALYTAKDVLDYIHDSTTW